MALLEVQDLSVTFAGRRRARSKRCGASVRAGSRETLADRRRERLRQVGDRALDPAAPALSFGRAPHGQHPLRRPGAWPRRPVPAHHPRPAHRHDLPGADDSLNPLHSVERQITEVLFVHRGLGRAEARTRALELLRLVQIPEPETRLASFPHQLSGGQRQRVMIAMALAHEPDILIADEPTTALDVTIQAQILQLLKELQARLGMAILLITHDLTIVRRFARRVCVMTKGELVEAGEATEVFDRRATPIPAIFWRRRRRASRRLPILPRRGDGRGRAEGLVSDPAWRVPSHRRQRQGGGWRVRGAACRANRGPRRRERLGQDHAGPGAAAAHRQPGRHLVFRPFDPGPVLARAAPAAQGSRSSFRIRSAA